MKATTSSDNRLWAVLWLGLTVLTIPAIQGFPVNHSGTSGQLTLQADGHSLGWHTSGNSGAEASITGMNPELTPFFFLPVPVNGADEKLLTTLPGIGAGMAQRIIDYRKSRGDIRNADDFLHIQGIGPKRYHDLRDKISFQ